MLFSVGDPRAANPVFEHSETAKLRIVKKQEKEGSTVSAHCVVALNPSGSSTEQRYRMIVEDIRGLGRTRIRDILAEMFKTLSDEMGLEYENNQGKTVKTWIIPDMQGHRSEKIGESIERGTVSGVHLVDSRSNHAMDELDGAKIVRREMRIEIGAAKVGDKLSVLEEVKSWGADNGFDRLRIVWSDPKGAGKPERASVDTTQQDVKDTYFVKQVKVTVDEPLDQACEEIRDDMVEKIMSKAA